MTNNQKESTDMRPPESYTDEELIATRQKTWEALTSLSADGMEYDESPLRMRSVSFTDGYERLAPEHTELLASKLRAYPLIDLGGGILGWPDALLDTFGVTDYTNVDMQHHSQHEDGRKKYAPHDLLEYLSQIPEGVHANVTSNGVLMADWFALAANPDRYPGPKYRQEIVQETEYVRRLLGHVHRVLPHDGIFFANPFHFHDIALQQGLVVDEALSVKRTDWRGTAITLPVYRKTLDRVAK